MNKVDEFRTSTLETLMNILTERGEDVDKVASNILNFPCLIGEEEKWVEITVKIPKGTKDEAYDGYARREDYTFHCEEQAKKKAEKDEAKAKKMAQDKAKREKKKGE